ncbi:PAS domain S-box-containing protein [Paenibacillus phyllosphaerae]|uniref:histidine kinase n=1 Tax=Paenibacillus phyllosphaerae TaxID=274593 RepID=A0A7W5FQF1_9BACL|nr:DUF4084 domain-containing protein [Paenibacillus phyllosphaerae]MBB3113381.1 PAS domain S-box-containing protein [Paenibacillus phyllosphaerae]
MQLPLKLDARTYSTAIALYMIAFYVWNFSFDPTSRIWSIGCNAFSTMGSLTAAVWLVVGSRNLAQPDRRFWLLVAFGSCCYFGGDATWFLIQVALVSKVPSPGLPDVLYLLSTLAYILAIGYKIVTRRFEFRLAPLFDIAIMMTVAISLSREFIVKPIFLQDGNTFTPSVLISLIYITSDLVLLFGALALYWVLDRIHGKQSLLYIIFGMALQIAADSVYYSPFANSNEWVYAVIDPLYTLSLLLISLGGYVSRIPESKNGTPQICNNRNEAVRMALPYTMIVMMLIILLLQQERVSIVMWGFASSILLIVLRQFNSYRFKLKVASEEVRSIRNYLDSFVNHTLDAIHVTDQHGNVLRINHAFEELYGWRAAEILGKPLNNIPDSLREEYENILRAVRRNESVPDYETVRYTKSGTLVDVSITTTPILDDKDEVVATASITRNISARKKSEEALLQSEKLSVIGQLAAGVAYEIRNPLTTLKGFIQLQQRGIIISDPNLSLMLAELDRINLIVSEFLVLAKPQATDFRMVNIQAILAEIDVLLQPQAIMQNIQISIAPPVAIPSVYGESNQLKQVFINILKNAMEAMPCGGNVCIELRADSSCLLIRFSDQGCGIPQESITQLGDPFFTNKENGTGLGLMVSKQIIANHKGSITFDSTLGEGTTVDIRLPIIQLPSN